MPEPAPSTTVASLRDWSRRTLDRIPAVDLYGAWMFAQAECTLAMAAWRGAARSDKRDAHAVYVAALDREAKAADVLARRLVSDEEHSIMTNDRRPPTTTTTDTGIPAASDEHSLTVGPNGPTVLHDAYVVQKLQHFDRERVPERVVHAKGSGAFGFFEVTEDVTEWTSAAFLSQVGKRTPMFARFSTVAGELGSPDTVRDPRGFALKFYTEEGNYDLVGNNTPVFFIRDASQFSDFIHSQKRAPDTGIRSNDMQWDFWTLTPASAHQVAILFSDRGTPRTLRHMNGYGSHTYGWMNARGERFWVKYHFKTVQGVENFTRAQADEIAGADPDFHRRDLWDAIAVGDAPEWRLEMQIMPFEAAADYRFNPFDVTKVWPHADFPPITVGRMVLDRNPANHFAQVEQAAFSPANLVPGDRPEPGQDAHGPGLRLPRHAPAPDRHQLRATPRQRAHVAGALVQPRRSDDLPARGRATHLRPQLLRWSARRRRQGASDLVGRGGRDRPLRAPAPCGG